MRALIVAAREDDRRAPAPAVTPAPPAPAVTGLPETQVLTPAVPAEPKAITNSIGMKLVLIPAGEFLMGSPDSDNEAFENEKPQHWVRITKPFYLGTTPVTQGQYQAITGENPSHFQGSDDLPVEQISWENAIAFCNKHARSPGGDPPGPSQAPHRVVRGGSWGRDPLLVRAAYRGHDGPALRHRKLGFRVARVQFGQ